MTSMLEYYFLVHNYIFKRLLQAFLLAKNRKIFIPVAKAAAPMPAISKNR